MLGERPDLMQQHQYGGGGAALRPTATLESLYPQARKLQFELKMQMSYLDSGRTGGKSDGELQGEARGNLSQLQQLLWQLESLANVHARPAERDTWAKCGVGMRGGGDW